MPKSDSRSLIHFDVFLKFFSLMHAISCFMHILYMASFSFILKFFFFLTTNFIHLTKSTNVDGFVVGLIHRDSHVSPFHNHSLTTFDRIRSAVNRSFSRLNHIHSLTSSSLISDISPMFVPDNGEYFMIFSIGTPPRQVYALADSGSEITWVNCLRCKQSCAETPHTFDPFMSSSYKKLSCGSPSCNRLDTKKRLCKKGYCYYTERYGDGLTTTGALSSDKFSFEDACENAIDVGYLSFGCSDDVSGPVMGDETGIVGLSRQGLSLVSQLGYTSFAYCMAIPASNQRPGTASRMYFGSKAVTAGGQAPLVKGSHHQYYYLTLQGISVGDDKVPIPSGIFDITDDGRGGFIIDSGTTYTMLREEAFDALVEALRRAINLPQMRNYGELELCFRGSFEELALQPDVTFHFYGTDVILTKETTYEEIANGIWCLAMLKSKYLLSILGNVQQRNYYIAYDLEEEVVSFAPVDCTIF